MSTTRFWGEPDDGVKVRHAKGGPLYEIGVKIWGGVGGNRWPEGSKLRGSTKTAICKRSDGVKENEYHAVRVNQTSGLTSDMLMVDPSMKWV